jgi:two-component system cell cycle sensor histidine kinase/response regulator CckA
MDDPTQKPDSRRITVLLVEDDPSVVAVTCKWLRNLGYEVLVSSDGRDADSLVSRRRLPIDILLTDVMLPGMRGPALAGTVRHRHPETSVVYISGYSPELVGEMFASDAHSAPLLRKPYTRDQLASTLRLALARRAARENARAAEAERARHSIPQVSTVRTH